MALVIDETAGGTDANSYLSLEDAKLLMEEFMPSITVGWDGGDDSGRKEALVQATRDIDSLNLDGEKYKTGVLGSDTWQALHFPTTPDIHESTLQIPEKVERATMIQAAYLMRSGKAAQETQDQMDSGITSHTVERLQEQMRANKFNRVCSRAVAELGKWVLKSSRRVERG